MMTRSQPDGGGPSDASHGHAAREKAIVAVGPELPANVATTARAALSGGSVDPFVKALEAAIDMSVVGLFVFGSIAGRPDLLADLSAATTDLDLLAFVNRPATGGIWGDSGSLAIDCHVFGAEEILSTGSSGWAIYRNARLLFDRSPPMMADWLARLQAWSAGMGDPWNRAERLRDQVWTERMVRRIANAAVADPVRAALYEARLLAEIAALHNQARGRFNSSLSHWWRSIKVSEAVIAEAVERYMINRRYPPDPAALEALFTIIRGLE